MKRIFTQKRSLLVLLAFVAVVTSCYTIKRIAQPHEITPGGEITSRSVIIYGEGEDQQATSYGCFGIRVPEGWKVTMPSNSYEQWENGAVTNAHVMIANEKYTAILNHRYPADGYVWYGFSTTEKLTHKLHKDFSDSIAVNCKIKAPADATLGEYEIEYAFGDETENFEKYTDLAWSSSRDNRLVETTSFETPDGSSKYNTHTYVECDTKITVKESSDVNEVAADHYAVLAENGAIRFEVKGAQAQNAIVAVYNAAGQLMDEKVANTQTLTLKADKGVNIVSVLSGNKRSVEKVVVK
jgi:hypothetical protein